MVFDHMNVTFNGYLALSCEVCKTKQTIESGGLSFEQDLSPEAEDDDYIRYITQVDTSCANCSNKMHVKLDVWEYPEAVANYSYYDVHGALDLECEFNIDHYFDDDATQENIAARDDMTNRRFKGDAKDDGLDDDSESEFDDEDQFNDDSDTEVYKDLYDDDN